MPDARPRTTAAAAWALLVLLAAVLVHLALTLPGGPDGPSDLRVYRGAVAEITQGGSLYAFEASNGDRFTYPPVAGLLLAPLALVPGAAVGVLWTLVQVGLTLLLAHLVLVRALTLALGLPFGRRRAPHPVAIPVLARPGWEARSPAGG